MILYFADKNFKILGTASTSLSGGYVITDDTKKEEVETGIATLDCTVAYTDDTRADIESWCRAGNYALAYYGKDDAADVDIVNLFMITTTELSVLDHTIKFESEDSGLDLLNNLAKEYAGTEQMSAADYINKVLEKTGFRLRNNNVSKNPKKLEWTSTDTVTKRLADIAEKFDIEITYGFSVKGLTVSNRWVDIADETGKDTKINLYINKEVNNITVKNTIENLATALYATGKDNLTLVGFTIPEEDKAKYQIDPDGNLVSLEALTKWARVDYSSKDSFSGNLYQKFESSDTASQADLYKLAKEKLDSISDIETNYEVDIADLPPGVGIGDRVNIVDDAGNTYISGRILELETSVTDGTKKATLGEYVIKDSGISELVENLASSFANLSKVRELYTWIAYADTIDGDGFSFSPEGKEYLGTAVNQLTEEAGTDPAVYKWVKIKGEQGETGAPGEKGDPGEDGYSPTVDLSTGESGSTVLTVTNKTGQTTAELKDQLARTQATDAQKDIDASKQYFYHDDKGAHIMDASNGIFRTDLKSDGMHINYLTTGRDIAEFTAEGQKLYDADGTVLNEISTLGISGYDNDGYKIYSIGQKEKESGVAGYRNHRIVTVAFEESGGTVVQSPSQPIAKPAVWDSDDSTDRTQVWFVTYTPGSSSASTDKYYYIPPSWITYTSDGKDGRGIENVRISLTSSAISNLGVTKDSVGYIIVSYVATTPQDAIVLFNRTAVPVTSKISVYTTKEIRNYPTVVINETYMEGFMHRGSGNFNYLSARKSAFVDLKVESAGDIHKKINGKDVSFTTITSGTGKLTVTAGAVVYHPRWWRCGNLVQMEVSTKCTGAVASGANIAAGKITGVPKPITKSGVRAVSYYGNNSNISYMGSDGTFYARNAGADALAKGNDCIGGFTYITDGTML